MVLPKQGIVEESNMPYASQIPSFKFHPQQLLLHRILYYDIFHETR